MNPNSNKTGKNRKNPVETEEFRLTKRSERMKVKCGTVLRSRMNIDDFALETGCGFTKSLCGQGEQTRDSISKVRRSNTHGKGNDKDSAGSPHGGEARNHQQAGRGRPGVAGRHRSERDQEEWRVHHSWNRQAGEGGAQGAAGSQSADRRNDQDQGQDRGEVPRGQGCEGHDRTGEEVVSCDIGCGGDAAVSHVEQPSPDSYALAAFV